MSSIFMVIHGWDEDGGIGDAVPKSETVAVFSTLEKAEDYVYRYQDPHVYDTPYDPLCCGILRIEEVLLDPEEIDRDDIWWNRKFNSPDDSYYCMTECEDEDTSHLLYSREKRFTPLKKEV